MIDNNLKAVEEFAMAFHAAQIFEARMFELGRLVTNDAALRTEIDRILDLLSTKLAEIRELMKICGAEIDTANARYQAEHIGV